MAGLSTLALLVNAPAAALRVLLMPIFYVFSYLLHFILNNKRFKFRQQSSIQNSKTWSSCQQERNKLVAAWSASASSKVLFVTFEAHLLGHPVPQLSEIVISRWSPGVLSEIHTSRWLVDNYENTYPTSSFIYGAAKKIQADEVSLHLTDLFEDFREQFGRVYLIGYKIDKVLSHMEGVWALPQEVKTIDTAKVWQAQHRDMTDISFEQCIELVPRLREHSSTLHDIGHRARLSIQLLQIQLRAISSTS